MRFLSAARTAVLASALSLASAAVMVDPALPTYQPAGAVSGTIKSVGSDSMNNLMTLWAEGFQKIYPNVSIEIEGKGSSTAPPALISGTSSFGPMSRQMKQSEIDAFEKQYGYKPTLLRTGLDALAVYVNKDNPIAGLSLQQVDAIFSSTRKGGHPEDITRWGQLGLTGEWADKPISIYGRNSASGTYGYFKEHALFKGDYKDSVKEQPGSSSVVQGVSSDKFGIGYSGLGYKTADVNTVPLSEKTGGEAVSTSNSDAVYAGEYPLARFLYVYTNVAPGKPMAPANAEFIKYVFSKQGQEVVIKDGYLPVTAALARDTLTAAGITPGF